VEIFIDLLVLFIAIEHMGFLYLEMFLWTKSLGRKIFNQSAKEADKTKVMAANQGLYNGFLAAGLLWGVLYTDSSVSVDIITFFLLCVVVAGLYGGYSVKRSIVYIQAFPALITLVLLWVF